MDGEGENCITMVYTGRHALNASIVGVGLYPVALPVPTFSTLDPEMSLLLCIS